jgi:hypothetical protein
MLCPRLGNKIYRQPNLKIQESMKSPLIKPLLSAGFYALFAIATHAATPSFTPGNLAVMRLGNGTEVLANTGNSVFIDEFNPNATNASPVSSVTVSNSGPKALVLEGTAASEGGLTLSIDRTVLAITGYNTNLTFGAALDGATSAALPRTIATIDAFGTYSNQLASTIAFTKQNPRFAVTDGTNNFWAVGGADGVDYFNPPNGRVIINGTIANNRAIRIFGGNLYFTSQKSTPIGLYTFTSTPGSFTPAGLVTSAGVGTNLVFSTGGSSSAPSDFAINPAGTVAYVADITLGIQKWTFNGSSWSNPYTFPLATGSQPVGAFALVVDFSGANPIIYATTLETNLASAKQPAGNHLARIVDTNSSATITYLAQAKTNQVLRGVDFAPNLLPLITAQPPASQSVAFLSSASLSVSATSPYSLSYQWQLNGTNVTNNSNIAGATTVTLNITSAALTNAGNYTVIITNNYGAVTSSISILNVASPTPPMITTQPTNQSDFIGGTASFTSTATGTPTPTYQWNEVVNAGVTTNVLVEGSAGANGETYTGTTNATLFISNVQTNDSGNYYFMTATSLAGSTNSQNGILTVLLVPPGITTQPAAQTVLPGQMATFSVAASGSYLGYQWMYITNGVTNNLSDTAGSFGETFSGTATPSMTITGVQTNDAGYYAVAIANSVGATNSLGALLNILILPPPSFISYTTGGAVYTQNFDTLPNPGAAYTNTVQAANPVLINGTNYSFGNANPIDFAAPILATNLPGGLGLSNTMPGWYEWVEGAGFNRFGANAGDFTTGGAQSFGSTNSYAASTNRALGVLTTSSTLQSAFTARFINNSPNTLSNMNLSFTGELWRQSDLAKSLTFYYVVDPTGTNAFDTNTTDYVYLPNLDVNFPTDGTATGGVPVDGTKSINQTNLSVLNQTMITNWTPGAALWLVWQYTNTTGKAQGIGIDNLNFSAGSPSAITPTATTLPASSITAGSATLNATINPNGGATAYWFQYGITTGYGSSTLTNTLAAGSNPVSVNSLIGGLLQGTTYHYQIGATNSAGTTFGSDANFTTLAVIPPQLGGKATGGGTFVLNFSNTTGASFSVLSTNNLTIPKAIWPVVGHAVESPAGSGNYQFTNSSMTNAQQFYYITQP